MAFPDHEHVSIYDPARAEEFCRECGLVLQDKMPEQGPPAFRTDDAGNLVGVQHGPPSPSGQQPLGSMMWSNRDARGRRLPDDPASQTRMARIKRVNAHGASGRQRSHDDMSRVLNEVA